jgi:Ser/Thr protein kinase RdoA (MazF antagonist)
VETGSFDALSPQAAISAVEHAYGRRLDATMESYPSYVNRVYGLRTEDGERLVVKFYRPGRWQAQAILEEHRFILDCADDEIPVIPPLPGLDGQTLQETGVFRFALFPRVGGRDFEPEADDDLLRLGGLLGRCQAVGARRQAVARVRCRPDTLTAGFVRELLEEAQVHTSCAAELEDICSVTLRLITPLFEGVPLTRIHGDCHRGNIINRPGQGLAIIDFDDMMSGPAVQDIWLMLPGYASESRRELELLLEGYERFTPFDRGTLRLIEPLRFMRMIYFLAWRARQREDYWFRASFPDWGTKAFWITETEDLKVQAEVIRRELDG